jgi:hypothetical protein
MTREARWSLLIDPELHLGRVSAAVSDADASLAQAIPAIGGDVAV